VATVVIDSNCIVRRDWQLTSAPWRVLAYLSRSRQCGLVVPELVVREAVGRYRAELASTAEKARGVARELVRLGVYASTPAIDLEATVSSYERVLRSAIEEADARVEQPPDVAILDLADRAIGRRRPFDAKGGGFRDAVLWEHVLATFTRPWGTAVLVTGDNAFKEPNGDLAAELRDDLEARGLKRDAVQVAASVADWVRATGTGDPEAIADVAAVVESEQEQIAENVRCLLSGADAEPAEPMESAVTIAVEPRRDPIEIVVSKVTAHETADDLLLVDLNVEAEIDVNIEMWEPTRATLVGTSQEWFGASATFDKRDGTLDNLSLETIGVDLDNVVHSTAPREPPLSLRVHALVRGAGCRASRNPSVGIP
jgi:PIN domain